MSSVKWYYSTWFISVMFALWFAIFPLVIGIVLLIKQRELHKRIKSVCDADKQHEYKDLEEQLHKRIELEKVVAQRQIQHDLDNLEKEKQNHCNELERHRKRISILDLVFRLKTISLEKELRITGECLNQQLLSEVEEMLVQQEKIKLQIQSDKKNIAQLSFLYMLKTVSLEKEMKLELASLTKSLNRKNLQLKRLVKFQSLVTGEILRMNDDLLMQSFGFYDMKYDLEDSQMYKEMLDKVRQEQKNAVKLEIATIHNHYWTLNNNSRQGEAMNKKNIKMVIRSFNNECDTVIHKVKYFNLEASEKKIRAAREQLDRLNRYNEINITDHYLNLKIKELYLAYEYAVKKQEEKEEQRRIKEQIQEERKAQEELEEKLKVLRKEEQHFLNALKTYQTQLSLSSGVELVELKDKIEKTKVELTKINKEKEKVDYRVRHAKAGFVYIISNIGSFGEGVYKIGMTRRLEPMDRVRELGDASVPFGFDVHAMIFSEDAPLLESSLHKTFDQYRLNKVNNRKEFFRVSLNEIERVANEEHNAVVTFTMIADAQQYRETMMIEKKQQNISI